MKKGTGKEIGRICSAIGFAMNLNILIFDNEKVISSLLLLVCSICCSIMFIYLTYKKNKKDK